MTKSVNVMALLLPSLSILTEKYTGGILISVTTLHKSPAHQQDFICRTAKYRTKDNHSSKEFTVRDETQHMHIFYKGSLEIIVLANMRSANYTIIT